MDIGAKLKEIRQGQRMTLSELAKKTGLSTGYLSNVERNINSPTIESLRKIVDALSISFVDLLHDEKEEGVVVRKDERVAMIRAKDDSILYELLSPSRNKALEAMLLTLKPGAASGKKSHAHSGEEIGYIITGRLLYTVGQTTYTLEAGDAIYYDASLPHHYKNIGDTDCVSIWVVTPPSF
ncbi:cupin domain-containing protein [Brevibacillus massiliensis]|jgi:transcriptional regulator with XRE-family HTH domain|uniref:cupin domain-containing protein n=1 Tax=Brevibacillus massiliensis TaxID=1118054 RepID=UPI000474CFBE|nr:cupin domain-containing protein [Brevibacillus massiliensis]